MGEQGTSLSFYAVLTLSWYFIISQDPKSWVVRQLVYTMQGAATAANAAPRNGSH